MNTDSKPNEHSDDGLGSPKKVTRGRIWRRLVFIPLIAVIGLYFLSMTAKKPAGIGVTNGILAPCPESPNCVSTTSETESQKMAPIPIGENPKELLSKIKSLVDSEFPRAKLVTESEGYLHFEFTSLIFRFVDDVEFLVNDKESCIDFRSASRVGHSDLGANRKRMSKISESLKP